MCGGSILSCCPRNPHGHERALKEEEGFCVFLEIDKTDLRQFFFQGFGDNTSLLQPALKSIAPGL